MLENSIDHSLKDRAAAAARQEGFLYSGIVDLGLCETLLTIHIARYDRWLEAQFEGEMGYLKRGRDRRANPSLLLPSVQSVFCVLAPYGAKPLGDTTGVSGPRFARYLRGTDYHDELKSSLNRVAERIKSQDVKLEAKVCVDTSAVLERTWASFCGLGWIGKNTLLIHPKIGSYHFIGVILLSARSGVGPNCLPNYCGHCSRCLDSCPTRAFTNENLLDARKCISYLTLERKTLEPGSDDFVNSKLRESKWVAGCDICQEVCPFNRKRELEADALSEKTFSIPLGWSELESISEAEYREKTAGSSLNRMKPTQFRRNLAAIR